MTLKRTDALAVARLVAQYNNAFDYNHVEEFLDVFTPDGVFVIPSGATFTGHDAIRAWFLSGEHKTIHVTTDPILTEDDGVVRHRCTLLVFRRFDEGVVLSSIGHYDDELNMTSSGWRFTRRAPQMSPIVSADRLSPNRD